MVYEIIQIFFEAVAAIAAIAAAIIAGKTLRKSYKDQKEGLERQKKQATLEAYARLQNQVLDQINHYFPSDIRRISEDNKSTEYRKLSGYLARIEHFCVGLTCGAYDYETFYALAHGYFDSERGMLKPRLLPMIEKKSENSDVDYYANLHEVWKTMTDIELKKGQ